MLQEVARRFSHSLRLSDSVALPDVDDEVIVGEDCEASSVSRLGGDEFTVLLAEVADEMERLLMHGRSDGLLPGRYSILGRLLAAVSSFGQ